MITDPFAPLAPTPAITTAAEARAAGRAAQDNREVPLHDITGHMYAIGVPRSLHYAYLGGIDDSLEDDGVDTTADPDADGYGWERKALAGLCGQSPPGTQPRGFFFAHRQARGESINIRSEDHTAELQSLIH